MAENASPVFDMPPLPNTRGGYTGMDELFVGSVPVVLAVCDNSGS